MKEKDFNTLLTHSFKKQGQWAYKIPDPSKGSAAAASKRPFDVFAFYNDKTWIIESKFLKKGYAAFPFRTKLEDHQVFNLDYLSKYPATQTIVMLGIWESRKYLHAFCFDFLSLWNLSVDSLHKKTLLNLYEEGLYTERSKDKLLSLESLDRTIIMRESLERALEWQH